MRPSVVHTFGSALISEDACMPAYIPGACDPQLPVHVVVKLHSHISEEFLRRNEMWSLWGEAQHDKQRAYCESKRTIMIL